MENRDEQYLNLANHRGCYSKFITKTFIKQGLIRCKKEDDGLGTKAITPDLLLHDN